MEQFRRKRDSKYKNSQIEELTKQEVQKARIYEEFQEKKEEVKLILELMER